ncbi:MAG: DUF1761 domain-containing protein [Bacteroidota bacterium]
MKDKKIKAELNTTTLRKFIPAGTAVLSFLIGWLWYSPLLFGKLWQKGAGKEGASSEGMLLPMIIHFMLLNVMAYGMRLLLYRVKVVNTLGAGAYCGLKLAVLFVATSLGTVYVYSGKPAFLTLWAIDAGYQVVILTVMGAILAVF